jgi:peptidyl-prolyl cis-trans isomerase A (cyclophilin A)
MRSRLLLAAGALFTALLAGCSSSNEAKKEAPATAKKEQAPDLFKVNLDTSKGPVVLEIHRDWAPVGADHFYTLVKLGFYDQARFFRVIRNFVVQFGVAGDPKTNALWANADLPDDPVKQHNVKGTLTFATRGPNSRSTQLFINLKNNSASLDNQGFAPIGLVTEGMDNVENFYNAYGELAPMGGQGPDPGQIATQGNDYLLSRFPRLDFIKKATITQ